MGSRKNVRILRDSAHQVVAESLAGAGTVVYGTSPTANDVSAVAPTLRIDPAGATRTLDMPVEAGSVGVSFLIVNTADAAEALTVRSSANATIGTILQDETAIVACDGTAWHVFVGATASRLAVVADPGDGVAIPVVVSSTVAITTAGAETRTLAIPTFAGQTIDISLDVDGGDCVITVAAAINQTGNNTLTGADAGDHIGLVGVTVGGALVWRLVANDGWALSTV